MTLAEELKLIIKAESAEARKEIEKLGDQIERLDTATKLATASGEKATKTQAQLGDGAQSLSGKLGLLVGNWLSIGVAIQGARKALQFVAGAAREAEQEYRTLAGLNALLGNLRDTAGWTALKIDESASAVESAVYADKQALMDATQELITYEGLALENLGRIHETAADLSVVLGRDVGAAARDLGRWLSDPAQYMNRMERAGITINANARNRILQLDSQNSKLAAQTLLLDEIEKKFGSVAEEAAKASPFMHLKTAFGQWKGSAGREVASGPLGDILSFLAKGFEDMDVRATANAFLHEISKTSFEELENFNSKELEDFLTKITFIRENIAALEASDIPTLLDEYLWREGINIDQLQTQLELKRQAEEEDEKAARQDDERLARANELQKIHSSIASLNQDEAKRLEDLRTEAITYHGHILAQIKKETDSGLKKWLEAISCELLEYINGLSNQIAELGKSAIEQVLGSDVDTYLADLNLPLGFGGGDLDRLFAPDTTEIDVAAEKVRTLQAAASAVWAGRADVPEDEAEHWEADFKKLLAALAEARSHEQALLKAERDRQEAERLILSLQTDEEKKAAERLAYETRLKELLDAKLITAEQYEQLLGRDADSVALAAKAEAERAKLLSDEEERALKAAGYRKLLDDLLAAGLVSVAEADALEERNLIVLGLKKDMKELELEAQTELTKLLSDEERALISQKKYQAKLDELLEAKLITELQYNDLLAKEQTRLGLVVETQKTWRELARESLKEQADGLVSIGGVANDLASAFGELGAAWAKGGDLGEAASGFMADFSEELFEMLPRMFIAAGLRCIIEGGMAGLGPGLGLIALGGVAGVASGIMGGGTAAISDDVMAGMRDELDARQALVKEINESVNTEYELLKRQLDRNIISIDEFVAGAGELDRRRTFPEAQAKTSELVLTRISQLDSEYNRMTGWDRFWSARDEAIKDDIDKLTAIFNNLDGMGEDELRAALAALEALGVSIKGIPRFGAGGDFVTSGPRLIVVGDNPGGREMVRIRPLGSGSTASSPPSRSGIVVQIFGDVYGLDDLYGKLKLVEMRQARRAR